MEKISGILKRFTQDFAEPDLWTQISTDMSDFSILKHSGCSSQQTVKF